MTETGESPVKMLVLGGCRSGKSRFSEEWISSRYRRKFFVATLRVGDDTEMARRVELHCKRRDAGWQTVEEPLAVAEVLRRHQADADVFLLDCLTMWLTNAILAGRSDAAIETDVRALAAIVGDLTASVVLVANEVGLGIVPESALARRFRDLAGWTNQQLAATCDTVLFIAAGLPLTLKGRLPSP